MDQSKGKSHSLTSDDNEVMRIVSDNNIYQLKNNFNPFKKPFKKNNLYSLKIKNFTIVLGIDFNKYNIDIFLKINFEKTS